MLVKIDTYFDGEYWCARGVNEDIFTQGETYDELLKNIKHLSSFEIEVWRDPENTSSQSPT